MIPKFKFDINIKTKLALQFMAIVTVILFVFAFLIYYFTYTTNKEKFKTSLLNRAKYTSIVINRNKTIEKEFLDKIFTSTYVAQNQEVVICNLKYELLYEYKRNLISEDVLQALNINEEYNFFYLENKDAVCLRIKFHEIPALLVIMANDNARKDYLRDLTGFLFWGIIVSMALTSLFAYIFSKQAFKPVSRINEEVQTINASNLSIRLDEGNGMDELERLAATFNTMLDGLEASFKNQAEFIANASHELKTPLAVMIAESEYLLSKDKSVEEYKNHIKKNIEYVHKFNDHLNNLLELARINRITSIEKHEVRLDEILYDAIKMIREKYPERKILTKIELPENDKELIIIANYSLMVLAFINLLDNAVKFSNENINLSLETSHQLIVTITDSGIGIPKSELLHINKPYKRAGNARYISGFGIGLSLVSRIFEAHGFNFQISSTVNAETSIRILFNQKILQKEN